jgi:hypothetical protein
VPDWTVEQKGASLVKVTVQITARFVNHAITLKKRKWAQGIKLRRRRREGKQRILNVGLRFI